MNSGAKITLSDEERRLVNDTGFILTKRVIIDKVYRLFGRLAQSYETILQNNRAALPEELFTSTAKISKGENYLLLPYVVLDYPRLYKKEDILAVRTMFWWGNFFSITLHVSGNYMNQLQQKIIAHIPVLQEQDVYICTGTDQWQHHFEEDNYTLLKKRNAAEIEGILSQQHFIKLAAKYSLQEWDNVDNALSAMFVLLTDLIKD